MQWLKFQLNGQGLREAVKAAVTAYYSQTQRLPRAVIVHPTLAPEARRVCQALELKTPVKPTGGCLTNERWLEVER